MLPILRSVSGIATRAVQFSSVRTITWCSQPVEDLIELTFVSPKGERTQVKGRIGDSILDVARKYNYPLDGDCNGGGHPVTQQRTCNWTERTYGEGPLCCNCHVVISNEYKDKIPAPSAEEQTQIDRIILEKHENSRLGCQVKLTKELDGMAVFMPHTCPSKIC